MIVAAGLGTRLRPLSELLPKPAMPVRGLPLIGYQLALLAHHGVTEVVINAHHLPERLMEAARRHCPPGLALRFSLETELLDTGGAIRQVAAFLRESDPCLIVGGDMLLDVDLGALAARHRARGDAITLLLLRDPRADAFGSLGIDAEGHLRRIARRFDLGGEVDRGLYTWVNAVSPRAFEALPQRDAFSHLDHWIAPLLAAGARDVRGELLGREACVWEPVGTPAEYLAANLRPPRLGYLDADARARERGVRFCGSDVILGVGATLGPGASLERVVVWDGERVPAGLQASDGVFAGARFHPCGPLPGPAAGGSGPAR
jgi:mannose-1-phosphate guanylyltransferase